MSEMLTKARLFLLAGASTLLLGALIFAVARWNQAATDRAFIEMGRQVARQGELAPLPLRVVVPSADGVPSPALLRQIEDQLRRAQAPAGTPPGKEPAKPGVVPR